VNRADLPPCAQATKRLDFLFSRFGEQLAIYHGIEQPIPVLLGYIGDKPRIPFTMEANLLSKATLQQKVGWVRALREQGALQVEYYKP